MAKINRLLTIALGLFLISAGIAKFTTGHVFQYIEYQSGIDIFYPFVNNLTGVAEVTAGAAILWPRTRLAGSVVAFGLMVGAVAFHLSPWLGVAIPTGLADGASAPWTASDFASSTSSVSLVMAVVTGVRSLVIARNELRGRSAGTGTQLDTPRDLTASLA